MCRCRWRSGSIPQVIGSLVTLLGNAGARRVRLLESAPIGVKPLQDFMIEAGWRPQDFAGAAKSRRV